MIIDSVCYLGFWPYWDIQFTGIEDLIHLQKENGIDHSLLCSTRSIFYDYVRGNQEVLEASRKVPERFSPSATVLPTQKDWKKQIGGDVKEIRLYPRVHGYSLSSKCVSEIVDYALKHGFPLSISMRMIMSWMFPSVPLYEIIDLARKHPELKIIVSGANYGEFLEILEAATDLENLYVDTLAQRGQGLIEQFVERIGPDRILFGTGMPVQYANVPIEEVKNAMIKEREKRMIFEENARKLFEL